MSDVLPKCPFCATTIDDRNRLITESCGHIKCKQCFLLDALKCSQCQNTTNSSFELNNTVHNKEISKKFTHILDSVHIQKHVLQNNQLQYECTICCKTFKSRSQVYYHSACGNQGAKKYKCDQCEKSYATKAHLHYHSASHKNEKYNCEHCGKQFKNLVLLSKHQKLHKNISQCCVDCGKLYRSVISLTIHKAKHHNTIGNTARFKCSQCHKEYYRKSTLRQHMLKHNDNKFVCAICNKRFQRNSTLQNHLKRHKERTEHFECTVCHRKFSDLASLIRHIKIHKVNLLYKCRLCHITAVRRDNMLRHVRNIHAEQHLENCIEDIQNNTSPNTTALTSDKETQLITVVEPKESEYVPKTVANSSVIKCVGNVEPVKIPNIASNATTSTVNINCSSISNKNVKKKYDPIEMYRKILISDDDKFENRTAGASMANEQCLQNKDGENNILTPAVTQSVDHRSNSNFSATHWRKNFRYTYEYQE